MNKLSDKWSTPREIFDWCIGNRCFNRFHVYEEYKTIFGNKKYYCPVCGSKINIEDFDKYKDWKKNYV